MAIYINGKKVAGRGLSGLSPYQIAVNEGYTGTENDFNTQLKNIGQAASGFDSLNGKVTEVEQKIQSLNAQVTELDNQVRTTITEGKNEIENKTAEALEAISAAIPMLFTASAEAPSDTRLLWIDTTANTGGLKYYNGTSWVHVPVAWT